MALSPESIWIQFIQMCCLDRCSLSCGKQNRKYYSVRNDNISSPAFQSTRNELNSPFLPLLTNLPAAINAIQILLALIIKILPCDCCGMDLQCSAYHWEQLLDDASPESPASPPRACTWVFIGAHITLSHLDNTAAFI